jgi:hypothetical protein
VEGQSRFQAWSDCDQGFEHALEGWRGTKEEAAVVLVLSGECGAEWFIGEETWTASEVEIGRTKVVAELARAESVVILCHLPECAGSDGGPDIVIAQESDHIVVVAANAGQ